MAVDYNTVSEKLFKVLKGHGYSVQMFDSNEGMEISDPARARFFYVKSPNIMVNVDQQNGEIKMHKGPESVESIDKSIKSVKNLARDNLLDFDLREFGREIKPKNYTFRLNTNTMKDITTESYTSLAGTTKTSSQNLEGAKLLIKHRKPVNEEVPGSRSRNIKALYIENSDGERFKYPFIHLNGARAMTRHVQSGGNPYDEVGQSIVNISEQLSKIREVANIVRRSPNMLEQASAIYNSLLAKQEKLRETMKRLTTSTGYNEYVDNFTANAVSEVSQDSLDKMKEKFTVSNIDSRIQELLPMIHQIHEEEMNDTAQLRQRVAQNISKGPFELSPRTDSQKEYSPDNIKQFSSKENMMAYKLSDMAARAKDDEVAVFLSRMSDKIAGEDKEKMTVDDVAVLKDVLKNIKDLDRSPKPAEEPKQIKGGDSIYEVDQLTESFNRMLGVFTDEPIVAQSNTVSEDMTAGEMMQKYTPEQRKKINNKAVEMMNKDGKDTGDHKLWTSYLNAAARMLGMQESDMGMNKYGLSAKHQGGKFYAFKDGVQTGGPFDTKEELAKHQEELLQQMDPKHNQESVNEAMEKDEVMAIMAKHPQDVAKMKQMGDLDSGSELYMELYSYYLDSGEMPYGTAKARDGDPVEWIMNRLDDLGMMESKVEEDNAFNTAAAQAAVKGEKNFTFNGKSYPVKMDKQAAQKLLDENPMTQADLDSERFADMHEYEDYKDAVMSDIKDPKSMYAGKSKEEIIAMLRKEADGIGYADVSDGDRHPSEPTWLNKIADEMEDQKQEDTTEELDRIKHLAGLTSN